MEYDAKIMNVIKQQTNDIIQPLADMGEKLIGELKGSIKAEFGDDFVVEAKKTALLISYFGYQIITRVEIELKLNEKKSLSALARLVAYSIDRKTPPEETQIIAYGFDKFGHVDKLDSRQQMHTPKDFAAFFLEDVFEAAAGKGMVLRPN